MPHMESKIFSRQQFYDLVWSDSLLALSKKYNMSDNGLRKACKRMNIPLPDMGYWNKIKVGKKVPIKPLPKEFKDDQHIRLTLRIAGQDIPEDGLSPQLSLQKEIESDPLLDLVVKQTLSNPDPLVSKAEKTLKKDRHYRPGSLLYAGLGNLDIRVSPELANRALCIMDTFIKVMRQREHDFSIEERESYLLIAGEKMKMTLRETQTKVIVQDKWERTEFHANGILSFKLEKFGAMTSCTDGKILIEHQLSKLIAKLELLGERFKLERAERKRWQDEYEEEQRIKKEAADRKEKELSSFLQLLKDSRRWKDVEILRAYIDKVEQNARLEDKLTEEMVIWLEWARKKSDWFDPLISAHDEWLQDIDPNNLVSQNNTTRSYNHTSESRREESSWPLLPWYLKNKR